MNKTLNKKAQKLINTKSDDSTKHPLVLMVDKNTLEAMNIYIDNNILDMDSLLRSAVNAKMKFLEDTQILR
jgi:hypothetical protein